MALEHKLQLKLSQKLVMTPSLQQAIKLLQLNKIELQDVVNQEILENPMLEELAEESKPETRTEEEVQSDKEKEEPDSFDEIDYDAFFQDFLEYGYNPRMNEDREEFRIENTLTRPENLWDHLGWQLAMSEAPDRIKEIGTFLIGNIEGDGFLQATRDEILDADSDWSPEEVETAISLIQSFDPIGVCTENVRESLLLQLAYVDPGNDIADEIIRDHWDLFVGRQFVKLSRTLGIDLKDLEEHIEIIKNLETRPGQKYSEDRTIYVEPDVWVQKVGDEYVIQLNEDGMPRLRISQRYRQILLQQRASGEGDGDTAEYIKDKMKSAIWLIKSLDQRQRTIYKVAESIVKHQRGFLENGVDEMRPLVLRDVADDIQMHESTVSRVVSNKYVHTPRGVFPFKYFFHSGIDSDSGLDVSSLSVKKKIQGYIDAEDPKKPLSDSKLMKILNREGINIARRTVAKYRDELKIPSSTDRKRVF